MIFAGKEFFIFLPVVLLVYHLLRWRTAKYGWLTLASWVFYAWASPGYLWVILLLTGIDWWAGRRIAILHDASTYGEDLAMATRQELRRWGEHDVLYTPYTLEDGGLDRTMQQLRDAGVEVAYLGFAVCGGTGVGLVYTTGISIVPDIYPEPKK